MTLQSSASNGDVYYATQYAIDKIVGVYRGSYTSGTDTTTLGGYLYQYPIPHDFTRPVFCELLVSLDGITYQDGGAFDATLTFAGIAYSDSSNIYITTGTASGTIYYKVICSWIDDYDTTNPTIEPVLDTTDTAYFDTRSNYQKVFIQDSTTVTAVAASDVVTSIDHDLGYTPNAKVFFESISGEVWPQIAGGSGDFWLYDASSQTECYAIITNTQLNIACTFPFLSAHDTKVWYRIYLDQG